MYVVIDGIRFRVRYTEVAPCGCEDLAHGYMTKWSTDSEGVYIAYRVR